MPLNSLKNRNISTQDWDPVVLRKKAPTAKDLSTEAAVNAARRQGAQIDTVKKVNHCSTSI